MAVKVYSTSGCPYCVMAKDFLARHKVGFEDINVEEDPAAAEEMVKKSGQYGVPVLDINGSIVVGFDQQKIRKLLGL